MMLQAICPSPEALVEFAREGTNTAVASHLEDGCIACGQEVITLMESELDPTPTGTDGGGDLPSDLWEKIETAHVDPAHLTNAKVLHLSLGPTPRLSSADGATFALAAAGGMRGEKTGWSTEIVLPDGVRAWLILTSDELRVRATKADRPVDGLTVLLRKSAEQECIDRVETDARGRARISLEGAEVIVELLAPEGSSD